MLIYLGHNINPTRLCMITSADVSHKTMKGALAVKIGKGLLVGLEHSAWTCKIQRSFRF